MGVSLNGGTHHFTQRVLIIFSRKTKVVGDHHFRKPLYVELGLTWAINVKDSSNPK